MFIRTPFKMYVGNKPFRIGGTAILESDEWQMYGSHEGMDNDVEN